MLEKNSYVKLTWQQLIKRGGYRLQVLHQKIIDKTPFTVANGSEIILEYHNSYGDLFANANIDGLKKLAGSRINSFPFFSQGNGRYLSFEHLLKTPEFGGKGKGSGTAVEDHNLMLLKQKINSIKKETQTDEITVILDNKKYKVSGAESQYGVPKADFYLTDKNGDPLVYISHKKAGHKGARATDFIRWSGYTMYKNHPEVKTFNTSLDF